MGLQVNIVDRKFYNNWRNRLVSPIKLNDFTRNLAASIGEEMVCIQRVIMTSNTTLTSPNDDPAQKTWTIASGSNQIEIVNPEINNWNDEDVFLGQEIRISLFVIGTALPFVYLGTVNAIIGNKIIFDYTGGFPGTNTNTGAVIINVIEPFTAVKYSPNLVANDASFTARSLVSNNDAGFYAGGVGADSGSGRSTTYVDMIPVGEFQGWRTGQCRVRFVGASALGDVQEFEIEHGFVVAPLFLEGQTPLFDSISPPDYLAGDNSLKYTSRIELREVLNNPNRQGQLIDDEQLGSVAWFNESFNGFQQEYEIVDIQYNEDVTNNPADGLLVGGRTIVTVQVRPRPTAPAYLNNSKFGIYFWYLAPESQYQNTKTNQKENFIWDSIFVTAEAPLTSTGTGPIKRANGSLSGGIVTLTFEVEFDAAQQAKITKGLGIDFDRYAIGIQTGADERTDSGDKITLLADAGTFDLSPDIPGLMTMENLAIYPHNEDPSTDPGYTNMTSWNEDGLYFKFDLNLNLAKKAEIRSLAFVLVAVNTITNEFFILNREDININSFPFDGNGVAQIDLDSTRGYLLKTGSEFNFLKIETGANTPQVSQVYNIEVGQKITWQDWIRNLNVPNAFVDTSKPNNNQNLKASNYSGSNDYVVRFGVLTEIFGESDLGLAGLSDYLLTTNNLTVYDYDKDGNDPTLYSGTIRTFRASNNEETFGKVLTGEDTIMEITWSSSAGAITDDTLYWNIHRIEEFNQAGFNIYELSSLRDSVANNLLKPLSGETFLKKEIVGSDLVTTCLIDGTKVQSGTTYNLSGRLGSLEDPGGNFKTTSPGGDIKGTSGVETGKTLSAP